MKKLLEKNLNLHFIVAGDGPLLKNMKRLASKMDMSKNISFLGKCDNQSEIYSICDVTVNCSLKEGLALTSYESLSMGVPVVSSDVGGQSELIDDSVGVIVPLMQKEEDIYCINYLDEEIDLYVSAIDKVIIMKNNSLLKEYINYYFMSNKDEYLWNIREYVKTVYGTIPEEFKKKHRKLYMFKYKTDQFFYKLKIGYQVGRLEKSIIKFGKSVISTLIELFNIIINFLKCIYELIRGIVR